ncbi:MAG: MOSC domain-containing protein [Solirubrobacteraceae bacterium]
MSVVLSVSVGPVAEFRAGRSKHSAIVKTAVDGRVAVRGVNVDGDDQADRRVHGGPDQAVYAYARESYDWWESELGRPIADGTFGENLTTSGLDVDGALIGERWAIGTALLQVTAPRIPCLKLQTRMGEPAFVKRFAAGRRPGAYLRIIEEGELGAGDEVAVVHRPRHGVTLARTNEILLFAHEDRAELLAAGDDVAARVRGWAAT